MSLTASPTHVRRSYLHAKTKGISFIPQRCGTCGRCIAEQDSLKMLSKHLAAHPTRCYLDHPFADYLDECPRPGIKERDVLMESHTQYAARLAACTPQQLPGGVREYTCFRCGVDAANHHFDFNIVVRAGERNWNGLWVRDPVMYDGGRCTVQEVHGDGVRLDCGDMVRDPSRITRVSCDNFMAELCIPSEER